MTLFSEEQVSFGNQATDDSCANSADLTAAEVKRSNFACMPSV